MGLLDAMREWLADCAWADIDDPAEFDGMPDWQVIRGVARWFDGGLTGFVREYMRSMGVMS